MSRSPTDDDRRQHARNMFVWEDQVRSDVWLNQHHSYALNIVTVFRKKMNNAGETGTLDHRWIGKQVGCCVRTVQRTIDALVTRNHAERMSGKAVGVGNRFRAIIHQNQNQQPVGSDSGVRGGRTRESDKYTSSLIVIFRAAGLYWHGRSKPYSR